MTKSRKMPERVKTLWMSPFQEATVPVSYVWQRSAMLLAKEVTAVLESVRRTVYKWGSRESVGGDKPHTLHMTALRPQPLRKQLFVCTWNKWEIEREKNQWTDVWKIERKKDQWIVAWKIEREKDQWTEVWKTEREKDQWTEWGMGNRKAKRSVNWGMGNRKGKRPVNWGMGNRTWKRSVNWVRHGKQNVKKTSELSEVWETERGKDQWR